MGPRRLRRILVRVCRCLSTGCDASRAAQGLAPEYVYLHCLRLIAAYLSPCRQLSFLQENVYDATELLSEFANCISQILNVDMPLKRRDPHYFLPTTGNWQGCHTKPALCIPDFYVDKACSASFRSLCTGKRYLLFGSDLEAMKAQFLKFFSHQDWKASQALQVTACLIFTSA